MARLGTFGAVAQHKLPCPSDADPMPDDSDEESPLQAFDACADLIGRADRAYNAGQRDAAADLYREAAQVLCLAAELCEVE